MTPSTLVVELLTNTKLIPVIEEARSAVRSSGRYSASQLAERVSDALGRFPTHQVTHAATRIDAVGGELPLTLLGLLAREHLCWVRGELRLRHETFLRWRATRSARVPVDLLWTTALAVECLDDEWSPFAASSGSSARGGLRTRDALTLDNNNREAQLHGPVIPSLSLLMLDSLRQQGLPELHRHQNLARLPEVMWSDLLFDRDQQTETLRGLDENDKRILMLARGLHRQLRLSLNDSAKQIGSGERDLQHQPHPPAYDRRDPRAIPRGVDDWLTLSDCQRDTIHETAPLVYESSLESGRPASLLWQERDLLTRAIQALTAERQPVAGFVESFHIYLLCRAQLHQRLVQPPEGVKGLDRFKDKYVEGLHKLNTDDRSRALVQAWRTGAVRWAELRFSPSSPHNTAHELRATVAKLQASVALLESTDEVSLATLREPDTTHQRPGVRIILHFIRNSDAFAPSAESPHLTRGWSRHHAQRTLIRAQAEEVWEMLGSSDLAGLIVGLDIASYELSAPNEVFTPWLRALRRGSALGTPTRPVRVGEAPPALGLTLHAGEEFRSLLEGMRSIDEAVRFASMEAGDRLGHALAVGLNPADWADRAEGAVLQPRLARLDDLVWVLPRLQALGRLDLASEAELELEELAGALYPMVRPSDRSARRLYRAWLLRGCLPEEDEVPAAETPLRRIARRMSEAILSEHSEAKELWRLYLSDHALYARGEEIIEVPITRAWREVLPALQDQLLDELARRGVVIEANPSSNVAISSIRSYTEHPIFRWFPPGAPTARPGPAVVVGSDDPAIFGSELYHEYAALACAALERGHNPEEVQTWLWRLREAGLRHLFGGTSAR